MVDAMSIDSWVVMRKRLMPEQKEKRCRCKDYPRMLRSSLIVVKCNDLDVRLSRD